MPTRYRKGASPFWFGGRFPRRPPDWWPEGEAWPPPDSWRQRGWRMRRGLFWRFFLFFGALLALTAGGCALTLWLGAALIGVVDLPQGSLAFAGGGAVGALLVGLLGISLTVRSLRRLAAPVESLVEAAGRLEQGDYSVRVRERGPGELRALARAFNGMAERLERDSAQRRTLLADVSHELRTPLTVIQGQLEGLLDGVYPRDDERLRSLLDETEILARLVDDLRLLALAERGELQLHREPTDLAILASEVLAAHRAHAEQQAVTLDHQVPDDLPLVDVDPMRLRQVLSNLLANALRYTPAGGRIELSGAAGAGGVTLAVTDSGSGIAPEALPHVFDRFYKSEDSPGSGLGLAIARNLVEAHGGQIEAESRLGQGTTLRLTLPQEATADVV